jgi:hypothetical protein
MCWGIDYDSEPVTDASNHIAALAAVNQGLPTVQTQMHTHGAPAPRTPDVGGHG